MRIVLRLRPRLRLRRVVLVVLVVSVVLVVVVVSVSVWIKEAKEGVMQKVKKSHPLYKEGGCCRTRQCCRWRYPLPRSLSQPLLPLPLS